MMAARAIGVLHPGAMGVSVAMALRASGNAVFWCEHGRSAATKARAEDAGIAGCASLDDLVQRCDVLVSVCPPEYATALAEEVSNKAFQGLYVDVNAIAPKRAENIGALFPDRYVDGGIIGPPAHKAGTTRLYLSGARSLEIQELFAGSMLEAIVMPDDESASFSASFSASGLKMSYAAWTKGNAALLLNTRALAEALHVGSALESEWARSQPGLAERVNASAAAVAPKAWRFSGEMEEIAATFAENGLPSDFHQGAAQFYELLAGFKDKDGVSLTDLLAQLKFSDPRP